jgi:hypothetical protein
MYQLNQVLAHKEAACDEGRAGAHPAVREGVVFVIFTDGKRSYGTSLPLSLECLTPCW